MTLELFNLVNYFYNSWSWGPEENYPLLLWGAMGFLVLNIVAIICARFADLLHIILKKG